MVLRLSRFLAAAVLLLMLAAPGAAFAQTAVKARAALHEGFGRIVFDWPTPTAYSTQNGDRRLTVTFDEPFTVALGGVSRVLGDYLSAIRLADDGRTIEIDLAGDLEFRAFAYGPKVIVDLMDPADGTDKSARTDPEADPVAKPAKTITATNDAGDKAGDKAAAARDKVIVRVGNHPNFSRLVFDWPGVVNYKVATSGNRTLVLFDRPAEIDIAALKASLPKLILSAAVETTADTTRVILVTDPSTRIRHFRADLRVVVDALVTPGADETDETAETAEAKPAPAEAPKPEAEAKTEAKTEEPVTEKPDETPIAEDAPAEAAPTEEPPLELAAEDAPDLPPATDENIEDTPLSDEEVVDDISAEEGAAEAAEGVKTAETTSTLLNIGPPPLTVTVENETNRTLVTFGGEKRISSAVFLRSGYLWVIFESNYDIDLEALKSTKKTAYTKVEQRKHARATVLRFKLRNGFGATMRRRGLDWLLQFTTAPQPPDNIAMKITGNDDRAQRLQLTLAGVGEQIQVLDPADRSTIDVVPVLASGLGVTRLRRYAQFDMLATLQGVAVTGANKIKVFATVGGIEISSPDDLAGRSAGEDGDNKRTKLVTTLFEFSVWRRGGARDFVANRIALNQAVAKTSFQALNNARMDLIRFLFANGYMAEAYGVLELMIEKDPASIGNVSLRAMRGVMNLAMNRVAEARGDLSSTTLEAYDDIALWRGVLAMKQGDIRGAAAYFVRSKDLWRELPQPLRNRVGLLAAEAFLEIKEMALVKAHLDVLRSTTNNYDTLQRVKFLTGRMLMATQNREKAVELWREVIAGNDRLARARAIFDDTELKLAEGKITKKEAISDIEGLRYAWRSDEFELSVLQRLAALYISDGQYRQGLATMKLAVTDFPTYSATAVIAARMNELFAEIFLRNGAEDLAAIDALTLYFEFEELTPVGAEGDQVIQKLADRLVALDLLGRAGELLEHQLKYRLKGVEMARVGTRLAVIQLMNGKPKEAIRALRRSRLRNMPDELLVQRRHIRARALADMGREEDALKRLAGDDSLDAETLRADFYWRSGNWSEVAKATERLLDLTNLTAPLSEFASRHMLRYAVSLALNNDSKGLKRLNRLYSAVMKGNPNQQAFNVITSDAGTDGASFRELPKVVAQVANFEAFMTNYRERVKSTSLSAIN